MNLQALARLAGMFPSLNLAKVSALMQYADRKLADLTVDDLRSIADVLGIADIDVTPELREAGLALLKGQNVDSVADMIQSPESIHQLVSVFQKKTEAPQPLVKCPHCRELFFL